MGDSPFSVPPRAARRRALAEAMRASRPNRTKEVFSLIPVSLAARLSNSSSMLSVVLICTSMPFSCILIKFNVSPQSQKRA
jgi:hypothetical protein